MEEVKVQESCGGKGFGKERMPPMPPMPQVGAQGGKNIENKIDIGYHLIIEDVFSISVADINKSKEIAEYCIEVGLEDCELLK